MHGRDTTEVHPEDLTLDKFIDAATLTAARPSAYTRTVVLTGATGFLERSHEPEIGGFRCGPCAGHHINGIRR